MRKTAFLALILTSLIGLGPISVSPVWVQAQVNIATTASISMEPNPAQINHPVKVTIRIEPAPPTSTETLRNLMVTLTHSDGSITQLGSYNSNPDGSQNFSSYVITGLSGNWTVKLNFPGQNFANGTIYYLPSENQTTITVTPNPTTSPTPTPPPNIAGYWTPKASMQTARSNLGVAVVNDKIYAIGGSTENGYNPNTVGTDYKSRGWIVNTNEEYDPETDTWTLKTPMPTSRYNFAITAYQNKIYCIGGVTDYFVGYYTNFTGVNEVYDPQTNTWTTQSPMPIPREGVRASVLNGKIYLTGGNPNGTQTEVYDPIANSWTTKAPMPTNPISVSSVVLSNKMYIAGMFVNVHYETKVEIYDPKTDSWSQSSLATYDAWSAVAGATTGAFAPKRVYVFGVQDYVNSAPLSNQVYNTQNDEWVNGANVPTGRTAIAVAVVNDKLYAIGGHTSSDPYPGDDNNQRWTQTAVNEQYTPPGYGTPDPTYQSLFPEQSTSPSPSLSPSPPPTSSLSPVATTPTISSPKPSATATQAPSNSVPSTADNNSALQSNVFWIAATATIVVVGLIAVVAILKKKQKPSSNPKLNPKKNNYL
jgi:N-acetylneuraminic acid mutarotase